MRYRALFRALAALVVANAACGSSPALHDYEPTCGGVEPPPPCDIEPSDTCLGSALTRITERDASRDELEVLRARLESGTVAIRRPADGPNAELVPNCHLDGSYHEVLGESGSGRLWVAERVVFAPSEVGASCETATHTVAAFVLGPEAPNTPQRAVALLAPLPCPYVDERTPAPGCIGAGLNGRARVQRALDLYASYEEYWKAERSAEKPPAKAFTTALDIYALAPDHRENDGDFPDSIAVVHGRDLGTRGAYVYANANWVIEDVNQTDHLHGPPRFERQDPPLFLDCFPALFDPAVGSYEESSGGYCWRSASSGPQPERTDASPLANVGAPQPKPNASKPASETREMQPSARPTPSSNGPAPVEALIRIKEIYGSGDIGAAKTALEELRQAYPRDARVAYYSAATLRGLGDKKGALREYAAALELDPRMTKASIELAKLLFEVGDAAGTLRVADAALKTAPKDPELMAYRAFSLDALAKTKEALAAYPLALKLRPDDPRLHVGFGALLSGAHRSGEALEELRAAMTAKDPALLEIAAEVFTNEGAFDDCIRAADNARQHGADSVRLLVRRAICKDGNHDESGARKDYEMALTSHPNDPPANFHFGLHLAAKDGQKALEHLDLAARIAGERGVGPDARKKAAELRAGH